MVSVAVTVKLNVPVVVGVPESTPRLLRVSPVGRVPSEVVNVLVPVPPDVLMV